jgi:hypothetical protein
LSKIVLSGTPGRWKELCEALPAALLLRQPAAGEWSALECLQHLVDTERRVFPARMRALLAGQNFPAFNPDSQGTKTAGAPDPSALAAEFERQRKVCLALLETVAPADLQRQARHAELGPVTLAQLLNEWVAHDLMHTVQAERALMQPFIQDCGPWQVYFKDYLA